MKTYRMFANIWFTMLAALIALSSVGDAEAANRIFKLHLQNGLPTAVNLQVVPGRCYEGTPRKGILGPIQPNRRVTITIARIQGHGCDGKQGIFSLIPKLGPHGTNEYQFFDFDNAGHLGTTNFTRSYTGYLSPKNATDGSYTWMIRPKDSRVNYYATHRFRHVVSNEYLIQHWHGNREDKRTTRVWPLHKGDSVYDWVLRPAGNGWNYIANVKTGLVLTQDSGGAKRNVSNWGRLPPNHPHRFFQHWQVLGAPGNTVAIVNRGSKLQLVQRSGGTIRDDKNVHVHPVRPNYGTWRMEQARPADLAKLTIERIKAIKVSTGQDANTKLLFQAIETAAELSAAAASGGTSAGLGTIAKTAAKTAFRQGARAGSKLALRQGRQLVTRNYIRQQIRDDVSGRISDRIKDEALRAGNRMTSQQADSFVELAFNKFYGESPDQLEIRVNNVSVWPGGGRNHVKIKSQQVMTVNTEYIFERQKGVAIQLFEYDSGSGDDNLGWITLDTKNLVRQERFEEALIINKSEGSVYAITFRLEPLYPKRQFANQTAPGQGRRHSASPPRNIRKNVVGEYVSNTGGGINWYRGQVLSNGKAMWWANQAGYTWKLTPDFRNNRLLTGPKNPWGRNGHKEFKLVMGNGKVTGFKFGGVFYKKQRTSPKSAAAPRRRPSGQSQAALPGRQPGQQHRSQQNKRTQQNKAAARARFQKMVVGNYVHNPEKNGWHRGAILGGKNGEFKWYNRAQRSWILYADLVNQRLLTGKDNPYFKQGPREFKIVRRNGRYVGFQFGRNFFKKLTEKNPSTGRQSTRQPRQHTRQPAHQQQGYQQQQRRQNQSAFARMATGYGKVQSSEGTFDANYELWGKAGQMTLVKMNVGGRNFQIRLNSFSADKSRATGQLVPCEGGVCPCNLSANEQAKRVFGTCKNNAHPEQGQMQFRIQVN